ncbi:MAG: 30S ribosomal protein S4 [Aquificaceae bacterium]|nr:30S ribosomal protein S4 [Aquificaceae bacterium]MCS7195734.1 30S ribosomal protein S4 [Aquificaceae bacterium]MCX7989908.1 30S ribosomal protein S4 [Aquificaceae bacterium]MDW8032438.1 30S ribosomal protein S4 [Aquificaceae bacterium]MDW8294672.1 30S ribosomal protein S4 [Aquificaceae bacterium]
MGRYIGPQVRTDRKLGAVVSGKKSAPKTLARRNFPPGQHGRVKGRRRKLTEYGVRLMEKQKLKFLYGGLREKQFRRYFDEASRSKGNTGQVLLQLLERRLDNVVYRLGFASTRRQARQWVAHGHFLLNGKKVDVPSYRVEPGDIIEVKPSSRDIPQLLENIQNLDPRSVPSWLELDKENLRGKVIDIPRDIQLEVPVNLQYIIEFYSRV